MIVQRLKDGRIRDKGTGRVLKIKDTKYEIKDPNGRVYKAKSNNFNQVLREANKYAIEGSNGTLSISWVDGPRIAYKKGSSKWIKIPGVKTE